MAYDVELSARAREELDHIIDYIARKLDSPIAAAALVEELEYKLHLIATQPHMYPVDEDMSVLVTKRVRSFAFKRYVGWYAVSDDEERVVILAILHGTQDAANWLSPL